MVHHSSTVQNLPTRWLLLCVALLSAAAVRAQEAVTIRLTPKPATLLADGVTSGTITAEVRDDSGRLVPDGQVVAFSTTLGSIETTAPTRGGQASVQLTSPIMPGLATVTASSGRATSEVKIMFVAKAMDADEASRSIIVRAKYLLYNDYEQVLDAAENVHIRIGRLNITADRAQLYIENGVLVAQGRPGAATLVVSRGKDQFAVDKLRYDWAAGLGMASGLTDPARGLFQFSSTTMKLDKITGPAPDDTFLLADLIESPLAIKASRAVLLPGTEIQFTRAQVMLNGKKRIGLPYHVMSLGGAQAGDAQYVGLGDRGPLLDIPYYVAAGEVGTSQLRFKYNAPEGLYGASVAGWALDLVNRYAFGHTGEGRLELNRVTSPDWGLFWTHNQQFGPSTRAYLSMDTRSGGGVDQRYTLGSLSFSHQARQYTATVTGFGSRIQQTTGDARLSLQSTPKPLFGGFNWNVGTRYTTRWSAVNPGAANSAVRMTTSQGVDARISAPAVRFAGDGAFNASIGHGVTWSEGSASRSLLGNMTFLKPLGRRGALHIAYNYNDYDMGGDIYSFYLQEKQTVTASLNYAANPRWTTSAFATLGLTQGSRNYRVYSHYRLTPRWRFAVTAGYFEQGYLAINPILLERDRVVFRRFSWEARITRQIGERALALVYENAQGRVYLDYTPGRNF